MLEGTQAVKISWLKEKVSQLEDELKGRDKNIQALTSERVDLIEQVQTREVEALSTKELLKEAEFMKDVEVARTVAEVVVKFKELKEFTTLLKKDYHNGYNVKVVEIFYNIWAKYQDLDYTFLGGEFTNLIGEWLEVEKLNAPDPAPSSPPPSPSTEDIMETESVPVGASKPQPAANVDKNVAASNPPHAIEKPVGEVILRVAVKTLINLEEEPVVVADTDLPT